MGGRAIEKSCDDHDHNHTRVCARTISDKASSWCGNRNAINEKDGVSEVTDIAHLTTQQVVCR